MKTLNQGFHKWASKPLGAFYLYSLDNEGISLTAREIRTHKI